MTTPTRTELAIELLQKKDRCAHVFEEVDLGETWVCTRMKNHPPGHTYEPVNSIIPF